MYCSGTCPSSWEIGAFITLCVFMSKVPDAFRRFALLNSSELPLGILIRGEKALKVDSKIWSRFTIYIYENPVEAELDLLFRNLSASVNIQNLHRHCWQDTRQKSCVAASFTVRSADSSCELLGINFCSFW